MKVIKNLLRAAVIGLASLLISVGVVQANATVYQPDSEFLARWQATYDGLLNMKPNTNQ